MEFSVSFTVYGRMCSETKDFVLFVSMTEVIALLCESTLWHNWGKQTICGAIKDSTLMTKETLLQTVTSHARGCAHKQACPKPECIWEREMLYLTTHSTHFIYGYMASDIWLMTILIVRKETRRRHIGYSYRLTARVLLYAPSHRQDNTNHSLCYTSCGALAGTRSSSMGPPHEGSIRRPTAPWANRHINKFP